MIVLLAGAALVAIVSVAAPLAALAALHHIYFDRGDLPDLGPLTRFEFPTIGHIYDTNSQPLIELARSRAPADHAVRRHPADRPRRDPRRGGPALLLAQRRGRLSAGRRRHHEPDASGVVISISKRLEGFDEVAPVRATTLRRIAITRAAGSVPGSREGAR